ncbi:MAG: deoxyribonuclease HsdR, partial [Bacteroidia bacterium]
MNNLNKFLLFIILLGVGGLGIYLYQNRDKELPKEQQDKITYAPQPQQQRRKITAQLVDLRQAAAESVKAVVHVKTQYTERANYSNPFLEFFYGYSAEAPRRRVLSNGSGVIISSDGYIVTNNHVIERSDRILVVLNDQREFPARLVGVDKNTDLALLKIEADNLSAIRFADSDEVALGEWVLAVGNPYNLTSTVTAGIVS